MLSILINFYNNRREAQNSLYSLSRAYARVPDLDYEVLAVGNGSTVPLSEDFVRSFGPEFHFHYHATRSVSPVEALNGAAREARGEHLMVMIDGAHILSPGILPLVRRAFNAFEHPFIATTALHLGPKPQDESSLEGYTTQVEDALLAGSHWRDDGYRLFNIAHAFGDRGFGWFGCPAESNCFALRRDDFLAIGGFDERFQTRGGGLANLDLFRRAVSQETWDYVMLLGEATFHQYHGAAPASAAERQRRWDEFAAEYAQIRGMPFQQVERRPFFMGALPREALVATSYSAYHGLNAWQKASVR